MNEMKDFLGVGWAFPVATDKATGKMSLVSYERDIEQAIRIILGTRRGERVMNPDFGSRLHEYVFAERDYETENRIKEEVIECLTIWEPRITDIEVNIDLTQDEEGGFTINLAYTVRKTNNPYNLVYPFYLTEGAPLSDTG